ncbi:hypothetical protein VHEMI06919 [[Torrubiella] hemipterigena]|uniref:Uncharacterized protein n=1 Tax=[Torrubiella] hemipterigena TaxID=1531966 RepID=A0A0A1T8V3_9HYPO|nr:hypothetical protein VHEMI06919 [[Torrubiella] hemipterigena]
MPYRLDTHVLTVDTNIIHKVDTANPANLYSMWTVFSRCADSVEQGRRLENLSWRLWQREQLVNKDQSQQPQQESNLHDSIPYLSGSVDSLIEEEAGDVTPLDICRPRIHRLDSTTSNRSRRDRHISSDDFEKMVVSIVQDKTPLSAPSSISPIASQMKQLSIPEEQADDIAVESDTEGPEETESAMPIPHPVGSTRAPEMSQIPVPVAYPQPIDAASNDSIPEPKSSPAAKPVAPKKPAQFALGGSCSSSEQSHSVDGLRSNPPNVYKKSVFHIGGSSEDDASLQGSIPHLPVKEKKLAPPRMVLPRVDTNETAIDSDTEGEDIDESAIDDDEDSSDWEDSFEESTSNKSSVDEKFFQRVESKANLASRPSLITLMLAQNERVKNLSNLASQSTSALPRSRTAPHGVALGASPNDSDEGPLMMKGMRQPMLNPISEIPRSSAQPIAAPAPNYAHAQAAFSPRTTRRNMLATELTESLRRHLLWERQQKTSTANAVLKRRHTSHDVANLKQFPDKPCMKETEDANAGSWNQYLNRDALNGYHSKGW